MKERTQGSRLRFGFFNNQIKGDWSERPWHGMCRAAQELGVDLFTFDGNHLRDPFEHVSLANVLYEIAAAGGLDGVIIWNHVLRNYLSELEVSSFLGTWHVPLVLIEGDFPGCPRIDIAGAQGVLETVAHLIVHHRFTKIGYLGIIAEHAGFKIRYQAFVQAMADHDLTLYPRMTRPFWDPEDLLGSGTIRKSALKEFLSHAVEAGMEALVCVSDDLAMQCLEVFASLGVRVPLDVALTGFDGVWEGAILSPPLTTALPDWEGLGDQALRILVDKVQGREVRASTEVEVRLQVRQSCGCPPSDLAFAAAAPGSSPSSLRERLEACQGGPSVSEDLESLIGFFGTPGQAGKVSFLSLWESMLEKAAIRGSDVLSWNNILTVLEGEPLPYPLPDRRLVQARIMVGNHAQHAEAARRLEYHHRVALERDLKLQLVSSFGLDRLTELLARKLPDLGIPGAWLVLYEDPPDYTFPGGFPECSRLVMAHDPTRPLPRGGLRFPTAELIPRSYRQKIRGQSYLVHSLHFDTRLLGYIVFLAGNPHGELYQTLRDLIAVSLNGTLLLRKVNDHAGQLSASLDALHRTQEKLVLSERMAVLGQLTATVAHELNTPLGAIRSAATFLRQGVMSLPGEYLEFIRGLDPESFEWFKGLITKPSARPVVSASEDRNRRKALESRLLDLGVPGAEELAHDIAFLAGPLEELVLVNAAVAGRGELIAEAARTLELLRASAIVLEASDRVATTVSTLVRFSSQSEVGEMRRIDPAVDLKAILLMCLPATGGAVEVVQELEPGLSFLGDGNQMNRVWMDLVTYSLQSMRNRGRLLLRTATRDDAVEIAVGNDGPPLSPGQWEKLFLPSFGNTDNPADPNLALPISRRIVEAHGGTLTVDREGPMSVLTVRFPLPR